MKDIDLHIAQLDSPDEADRIYAAADIGSTDDARGIEPLLRLVQTDPSRAVRQAAFHALARIHDDEVIPAAIRLLDSDDAYVRNQAIELLQTRGDRALPALRQTIANGAKDVRKLALDVLGATEARGASDIYVLALTDPDPNIVITAIEQIGRARRTEYRGPIEHLLLAAEQPMTVNACLEALGSIGEQESLTKAKCRFLRLADVPALHLPSLLKVIAAYGGPSDLFELAALLANCSAHAVPQILTTLGILHSRLPGVDLPVGLDKPLTRLIQSELPSLTRCQALTLLATLRSGSGQLSTLTPYLEDADRLVRIAAIEMLSQAGDGAAVDILEARRKIESDEDVSDLLDRTIQTLCRHR